MLEWQVCTKTPTESVFSIACTALSLYMCASHRRYCYYWLSQGPPVIILSVCTANEIESAPCIFVLGCSLLKCFVVVLPFLSFLTSSAQNLITRKIICSYQLGLFFKIYFFLLFWDRVSLCSSDYSGTWVDLELRDPHASVGIKGVQHHILHLLRLLTSNNFLIGLR